MKNNINKIAAAFVVSIFALSGIGMAYAAWTDTIYIDGSVTTGTLLWEIVPGSHTQKTDDPDWNCFFDLETGYRTNGDDVWYPDPKNVATTTVTIEDTDHPHKMTVTLDNAYPYYYEHIAFRAHCYGSIPLKIWKVNILVSDVIVETFYASGETYLDLDGDGGYDLEIWWGNGWGEQLHACQSHDFSFELLVLQPAPQTSTLTFDIELVAIQWNEYTPGPLV